MLSKSRGFFSLHSSKPGDVLKGRGSRTYLFGQCRCGDIWHMGCCTPLSSCDWLVLFFGVHKLLPQGPEGTEGDLDG